MEKTVDNLQKGEVLLVRSRNVNGGKVELEFAEVIRTTDRPESIVSMLNEGDDRFKSKPRRAWVTGERAAIARRFGEACIPEGTSVGETKAVNLLNPELDGKKLRIQITETITPNEYQENNIESSAKRRGADGPFITHKGSYIFSNTTIVAGEAKHVLLAADSEEVTTTSKVSEEEMAGN